jgi:hypothetical protein
MVSLKSGYSADGGFLSGSDGVIRVSDLVWEMVVWFGERFGGFEVV